MADDRNTVLVVDDDPACRDLHALWLDDEYDVLQAADGREALDRVGRADVMLLDREMPTLGGAEVARRVRDASTDCFVVMLSGVEPDFDIIDLPVDEYLTKPTDRESVHEVVDTLVTWDICQRLLQEYFSLVARKRSLERRKRPTELADSVAYQRLLEDVESKRVSVVELLDELEGAVPDPLAASVEPELGVAAFARS